MRVNLRVDREYSQTVQRQRHGKRVIPALSSRRDGPEQFIAAGQSTIGGLVPPSHVRLI